MPSENIQGSIESVIDFLTEHPEKARYTDKEATAVVEAGLRCRADGPDGAVLFSDMPKAIGGGGSAPTPGWLLRAALANCDVTVIAMRAAQVGISLTTLRVTIDSDSDDRGLLGMDDSIPAGPLEVRTKVTIGADGVPAGKLQEIVDWAEVHSPVADAVSRTVPTRIVVEIV
jgi:uncharacterized OsmC-like protein